MVASDKVKTEVCKLSTLQKATRKSRKGVSWKTSVLSYSHNSLIRNYRLLQELKNGTYKPIKGKDFVVYEPKRREITPTNFRDRVVQRAIVDTYLNDALTSQFIKENCACLKNRGTDYARDILKEHIVKLYSEVGVGGWFLKIDIKSFFASINHDIAKKVVRSLINNEFVIEQIEKVIDLNPNDKGIGLGSSINQYVALSMLHYVDVFVTKKAPSTYYVRYADDIIILSKYKEELKAILFCIKQLLRRLDLEVNGKKTYIQRISKPIHFLGFSFLIHQNGRITQKVISTKVAKRRRKIKAQARQVIKGRLSFDDFKNIYNGGRGHYKKGVRSSLCKMDKYYKKIERNLFMQQELIRLRKQVEELVDYTKRLEAEIAKLKMEVEHNAKN